MVIYGHEATQLIQNRVMNAIGSFFRDKTVVYRMRWLSLEICECDYCGSFIHEECIRISKFHCKQLTSSKPRIKHLWYCYLLFFEYLGWMETLILEQPVVSATKRSLASSIYLGSDVSGVNALFMSMNLEQSWMVVIVSQNWASTVILVDMNIT